jgi:hypothetical protein
MGNGVKTKMPNKLTAERVVAEAVKTGGGP